MASVGLFDGAVRIKDAAGTTTVLDLPSASYDVVEVTPVDRSWRRVTASSPFIDGTVELGAVLDAASYQLVLRCRGANWAAVETARVNLLNAVEAPAWTLEVEVEGVVETFKARRADSSSPRPTLEILVPCRTVSLSIPVTPHGSP